MTPEMGATNIARLDMRNDRGKRRKMKTSNLNSPFYLLIGLINFIWLGVMIYTSTTVAVSSTTKSTVLDPSNINGYILHFVKMAAIILVFNLVMVFGYKKFRKKTT